MRTEKKGNTAERKYIVGVQFDLFIYIRYVSKLIVLYLFMYVKKQKKKNLHDLTTFFIFYVHILIYL